MLKDNEPRRQRSHMFTAFDVCLHRWAPTLVQCIRRCDDNCDRGRGGKPSGQQRRIVQPGIRVSGGSGQSCAVGLSRPRRVTRWDADYAETHHAPDGLRELVSRSWLWPFSHWHERQEDFRQLIPIRPLGEPNSARISAACPVRLAAHFHLIAGFAQTGMMKIGAGVDHCTAPA